ncbi:MAG: AAA family ATPase [Candidatus Competibacteraceae bacterium]|nr:AAA family ATPase [Candidatus Competibacteraceae bacterium]
MTARKRKQKTAYIPKDLNLDQATAVTQLAEAIDRGDPICRLLGYAGTGKSFATVRLLRTYAHERPVLLTAPTNKAAAVLRNMAAEIGGDVEATTIHKALGLRPEVNADKGRVFLKQVKQPEIKPNSLVLVDEASMVDSVLMGFINKGMREAHAQVLYVGDPAQLPPVFEAQSPAFSGAGVTCRLTQIVRQAQDHPILAMTAKIRAAIDGADVPRFTTQRHEAGCLLHLEPADFETDLLGSFMRLEYENDPDYCRVLAWTNQRTNAYNRIIRRSLLGPHADQHSLLPGEIVVACTPVLGRVNVGDFVTVLEAKPVNHHGIPAYRAIIQPDKGKALEVFVVRPEGYPAFKVKLSELVKEAQALQKRVGTLTQREDQQRRAAWVEFFEFKDEAFCDLRPIHASTVHKSQGSTYQTVYVDLTDIGRNTRRDVLLRLLYVALTRARGDVVVTGELPDRLYLETSATCADSAEYA